jgi:archaellum component FlaC
MRTLKLFLGAAVLAAALAAPTIAESPQQKTPDVSQQLQKIEEILKAMGEKIAGDINDLRKQVADLRSGVTALKESLKSEELRSQKCKAEVDTLKSELEKLRAQCKQEAESLRDVAVADLKRQLEQLRAECKRETESIRRAYSYQPGAPMGPSGGSDSAQVPQETMPPPPPAVGTVYLRNFSDVNGTFFINGQPYAVLAGRSVAVRNVPAGTFTYQIQAEGFGVIHPFSSRPLPPGGTYTLTIDPRPVAVMLP